MVAAVVRPRRQRQPMAVAQRRSQHGVDEACSALLPRAACEVHGIIDHGGRWNAIEVEKLIKTEAKNNQDVAVHPR
jgi:hypothetical protein